MVSVRQGSRHVVTVCKSGNCCGRWYPVEINQIYLSFGINCTLTPQTPLHSSTPASDAPDVRLTYAQIERHFVNPKEVHGHGPINLTAHKPRNFCGPHLAHLVAQWRRLEVEFWQQHDDTCLSLSTARRCSASFSHTPQLSLQSAKELDGQLESAQGVSCAGDCICLMISLLWSVWQHRNSYSR